jgi:hypothetical protein
MAGPVEVTLDLTEEMLKVTAALTRKEVLVGIPDNSPRSGGPLSNAVLGYIHEFGSPAANIPARPFLIPTINKMQGQIANMLQKAVDFAYDKRMDQAENQLEVIGLTVSTQVKQTIIAGEGFAPLSRNTHRGRLQAAGQAIKPLIDTGQMLNSITYVVRNK